MSFSPFPTLATKRLTLRKTTVADCEAILFLRADKTVNKYVKRPAPQHLGDAAVFVEKITKGINDNEIIYWSITLKESPEMIGSICLWNFSTDRKKAETGYDLRPDFQNKGIMAEALKCVLDYGFHKLALEKIEAFTHRLNEPSKKLLTKNNFILNENRKDENNADNLIFEVYKPA